MVKSKAASMDTSTESTRGLALYYKPGQRANNSYIGSPQQLDSIQWQQLMTWALESTYLIGLFDLINVLATC
jgi:hypothetical protein